eukprot:TRINITY_DN43818_c0_g1_i1.p1 TRINITY_DN43818_c0_g1~~TRINITY_DN43818_c0_g1_i1.p1  ORF type:complete len:1250 (-),score=404.54 TRINITY_DN43818_c0_g1_i1:184-3678(-)
MATTKPKEEESKDEAGPPKAGDAPAKEVSTLDAMIAPPNPYGNRFGAKAKPAARAPMQGAFGAPPPAPAAPSADDAGEGDGDKEGEALSAPAAVATNPFAPKGFGGAPSAQPVNPFAPRAVTGAPVNPNAPKGFRGNARQQRPVQAMPSPFIASPFGAPAATPSTADPEGEVGDSGAENSEAASKPAESKKAPPSLGGDEGGDREGDATVQPPAVPPSPLRSSLPAYSPFARPSIPRGYGGRDDDDADDDDEVADAQPQGGEHVSEPAAELASTPSNELRTRRSPFASAGEAVAAADEPGEAAPETGSGLLPDASKEEEEDGEVKVDGNAALGEFDETEPSTGLVSEARKEEEDSRAKAEGEDDDDAKVDDLDFDLHAKTGKPQAAEEEAVDREDGEVLEEEPVGDSGAPAEELDVAQEPEQETHVPADELKEEKVEEVTLSDKDATPAEDEPAPQAGAPARADSAGGWGDFDFDDDDFGEASSPAPAPESDQKPSAAGSGDPELLGTGETTSSWVVLSENQRAAAGDGSSAEHGEPVVEVPSTDAEGIAESTEDAAAEGAQSTGEGVSSPQAAANGPASSDQGWGDDAELDELVGNSAPPADGAPQERTQSVLAEPEEATASSTALPGTVDSDFVEELARLREEAATLRDRLQTSESLAKSQEDELQQRQMQNKKLEDELTSLRALAAHRDEEDEAAGGRERQRAEELEHLRKQVQTLESLAKSKEDELQQHLTRSCELESQLTALRASAAAREEELEAKHEAEAAERQRAEAELAEARSQVSAQNQATAENPEIESKYREAEARRCEAEAKCSEAETKCSEAESKCSDAETKFIEAEAKRHEAEAKCQEAEERASLLEQQIQDLRDKFRSQPEAEASAPQVSDEFNLPDFVWSCGNSEVMAYVQKLVAENAEMKKNIKSEDVPRTEPGPSTIEVDQATSETAMAFAAGVAESDGHHVQSLLGLLKKHIDNIRVCSQVCAALETLTFTDAENRSAIVRNGGMEDILTMLRTHEDAEAALLQPAVDALWNLTFDSEAIERGTEAGAVERIQAVMSKQAGAAELQGGACAVLLNLAVKDQNRWKIVQSGGASLVAAAMERHSKSEEVLEQGCQALYMLAYHQELRPLVLAAKGGDAAALAASLPDSNGTGRARKWGKWLQEVLAC